MSDISSAFMLLYWSSPKRLGTKPLLPVLLLLFKDELWRGSPLRKRRLEPGLDGAWEITKCRLQDGRLEASLEAEDVYVHIINWGLSFRQERLGTNSRTCKFTWDKMQSSVAWAICFFRVALIMS